MDPASPSTTHPAPDGDRVGIDGSAIQVRKVTKIYGHGDAQTHALKSIDFETRSGELHMVVGPSGCGKTTLLSVIAGTLDFNSGEVMVFGTSLHGVKPRVVTRFRGQAIGFIFQQFNLIPTLSLIENVSIPLLLNQVPRREAEQRAAAILARVELGGREYDSPLNLSGGQQQRVAIARALVHEPKLVICDEPTSSLDRDTGQRVMELLAGVARAPGRCVIVVTHDSRIFRFADRITEMEDGRVLRVYDDPAGFTSGYH
jgi:putative ABC transport system ATP-binding protein